MKVCSFTDCFLVMLNVNDVDEDDILRIVDL